MQHLSDVLQYARDPEHCSDREWERCLQIAKHEAEREAALEALETHESMREEY